MKYAMIKEKSGLFSLKLMCRMLSVSVSGYYAWLNRKPCARKQKEHQISKKIKAIFDDETGRAGAPRITRRLNKVGSISLLSWIYIHVRSLDGPCQSASQRNGS